MMILRMLWMVLGMSSMEHTHRIYAIAWYNNKYTVYMLVRNAKGEVVARRIATIDGEFLESRDKIFEYVMKELKRRRIRVEI